MIADPSSRTTEVRRLLFVDVARSLAIVLALVAHAMSGLRGYELLAPRLEVPVKLVTRTATPLFVLMFGMMLELVYHRRWRNQGAAVACRRLSVRSLQCYLGYLATVAATWIAGISSTERALKASVFLATPSFGFTLRFYFFALLLAVPVLALRARWGQTAMVALLGVVWLTYPVLGRIQTASLDFLPVPFGIVLGPITRPVGPSVLQGSTFFLVGILCAGSLAHWQSRGLARFRRRLLLMMAIASLPVIYLCVQLSVNEVVSSFTGVVWRRQNHIGYYTMGVITAGVVLFVLSLWLPAERRAPAHAPLSLAFGRSSLLAFTSGNVILIFISRWLRPNSAGSLLLMLSLFLMAVWFTVISRYFHLRRRSAYLEG